MSDDNFWLEKWRNHELGFHLARVHPLLKRFYTATEPGTVLVPLAGKSLDMLYLKQTQPVLGVELSGVACQQFNEENSLNLSVDKLDKFTRYSSDQLELLQGNIFDLTAKEVNNCTQVYDRAALIALPLGQREAYIRHLMTILPRPIEYWLITLDYNQDEMSGPPYSVGPNLVRELFFEAAELTCLSRQSILRKEPGFASKGLQDLFESIYRIKLT